jgi:hypothetical protein
MPVAPNYMAEAARKALEARERVAPSRRAGTPVGLARANQLKNKENLSTDTLLRMRSYLSRTEQTYRDAVAQGKDITTSKQIMATGLWGGPKAINWVNKELKKLGL